MDISRPAYNLFQQLPSAVQPSPVIACGYGIRRLLEEWLDLIQTCRSLQPAWSSCLIFTIRHHCGPLLAFALDRSVVDMLTTLSKRRRLLSETEARNTFLRLRAVGDVG